MDPINLARYLRDQLPDVAEDVLDAVTVVDRRHFIEDEFVRFPGESRWSQLQGLPSNDDWLLTINVDRVICTAVSHDFTLPRSTSTKPSVTVRQIDSLDVYPDSICLEVGTGTGYAAALLASCVRSGRVVSIEAEIDLAQKARSHLDGWSNCNVIAGDGLTHEWGGQEFDRILLSTAVVDLPSSLIGCLRDGGRFSGELRGGLAGAVLTVDRIENRLTGQMTPSLGAGFMSTADVLRAPMRIHQAERETDKVKLEGLLRALTTTPFGLFVQLVSPSLRLVRTGMSTGHLTLGEHSTNPPEPDGGLGTTLLIEDLSELLERYRTAGITDLADFRVDQDLGVVSIRAGGATRLWTGEGYVWAL